MAFIRPIDQIAKKWADVTPQRAGDYEAGINNPRRPWAKATAEAEKAYEDGVAKSIARKSFGKGVLKAGDEKWHRKAIVNGVMRWGPGVAEAQGDYAVGFSPYRDAIAAVKLSPRYARRDPRNLARVKDVVDALVAKKNALMNR